MTTTEPNLASAPTFQRKVEMMKGKLTGAAVARALRLSEGAVSQTLSGYSLNRKASKRIMRYIAKRLAKTVAELWPETVA